MPTALLAELKYSYFCYFMRDREVLGRTEHFSNRYGCAVISEGTSSAFNSHNSKWVHQLSGNVWDSEVLFCWSEHSLNIWGGGGPDDCEMAHDEGVNFVHLPHLPTHTSICAMWVRIYITPLPGLIMIFVKIFSYSRTPSAKDYSPVLSSLCSCRIFMCPFGNLGNHLGKLKC